MNDLIDFLRSLVLTTIVIDKKYRETVPEIIAKMKTHVDESDKEGATSRKRKAKRPKIAKDGLYPAEDSHVRRWWAMHKPNGLDDDDQSFRSSETKYHISCLRRRETQLQMILIFEILALEPLRLKDEQLPGMDSQALPSEKTPEPGTKKKHKTNLPVLLEVHADRLCIWQSITLDDVKASAESQIIPERQETQQLEKPNSNPLREFCVDVLIPL